MCHVSLCLPVFISIFFFFFFLFTAQLMSVHCWSNVYLKYTSVTLVSITTPPSNLLTVSYLQGWAHSLLEDGLLSYLSKGSIHILRLHHWSQFNILTMVTQTPMLRMGLQSFSLSFAYHFDVDTIVNGLFTPDETSRPRLTTMIMGSTVIYRTFPTISFSALLSVNIL